MTDGLTSRVPPRIARMRRRRRAAVVALVLLISAILWLFAMLAWAAYRDGVWP